MKNRKLRLFLMVLLAIIFMNLAIVIPSSACTPAAPRTIEFSIENAPTVFVGTVESSSREWLSLTSKATVKIEAYLKGTGYEMLTVYNATEIFIPACFSLPITVNAGQRYIFFTQGRNTFFVGGVHYADSRTAVIADDDTIAYILAYTGEYHTPTPTPFFARLYALFWRYIGYFKIVLILSSALIFQLTKSFVKRRNLQPKSKRDALT